MITGTTARICTGLLSSTVPPTDTTFCCGLPWKVMRLSIPWR